MPLGPRPNTARRDFGTRISRDLTARSSFRPRNSERKQRAQTIKLGMGSLLLLCPLSLFCNVMSQ
eukprot:4738596-Amphidinium_carterae.1